MSVTAPFDAAYVGSKEAGQAFVRKKAQRLLDILVAMWIFSGGIVLFEPSPYELMFVLVLPVAIMAGLGLYRSTLGLLAIILAFTPFAVIAVFQVQFTPISDALIFTLVTIFLLITSYFAANYVAEDTTRRMRLIMGAYTAIAVLLAIIGTLAYLRLMPGADFFLRYGRAKATFKDPNVFAPFLILPAMFALQRVLLLRGWPAIIAGGIYLILFVGVFVSFSRAAWGHFAASSMITLFLVFLLEAGARDKVRIMMMSMVGAAMLVVALGGLLSIPSVYKLFETRFATQSYDTGETGRFGRQGYAFELALDHPWGLGPGEFRNLRIIEEPHNVYVSVLHNYGWGGGILFIGLIGVTLWKGLGTLLRPSPYRLLAIPLMATFSMLAAESAIIDSDHWRHLFLLIGLVWGVASAIDNDPRLTASREEVLV
ncbi:O-antigen ligase family protein [Devosia sp. FJ2-5-3]|uniref:O-antigen ligase family protein n=1 Tax=Devosia sp. FJ2-5-3 TaxID=2976680 RepID=UPI0023D865DE|nr:O-antigen ligase family protein [Devosia sp. FJ2-5-3]WEJ57302.1 O-antigen ligase family protein [Devosia sp. FJ2-5-3]